MKRIAVLLGIILSALAAACLWDSDTLAEEMRGKLDTVDALVGRIRRYPPIYYQKRIELKSPLTEKGDLPAFDDVAVAYSHLGDQDRAIQWIQRKRAAMVVAGGSVTDDIRYRTESNEGTFWLLKWLTAAKADRKAEWLTKSRAMIAAGLKINPNAHFGREKVQLLMIDWIIRESSLGKDDTPYSLPQFASVKTSYPDETNRKGFVGLMVLGAAWESPDVISVVGSSQDDSSIAMIANLRIKELRAEGKVGLFSDEDGAYGEGAPIREVAENTAANYEILRRDAKKFQARLAEYVTQEIQRGRHPDKDGDAFWSGFVEPPRSKLKEAQIPFDPAREFPRIIRGTVVGLVVLIVGLVFFVRRRRVRSRPLAGDRPPSR